MYPTKPEGRKVELMNQRFFLLLAAWRETAVLRQVPVKLNKNLGQVNEW
jgi:hypothetical protein